MLVLALAACARQTPAGHATDAGAPPVPDESGYLPPPLVLGAQRGADGAVVLSGRSGALVRVRLSTPPPTSTAYGATAGDTGNWSVATPAANGVQLYGVAEELVGRDVQGEGYVATLPAPGPAGVLLRAGGGAAVLVGPAALKIAAVDYDSSGSAVVSGLARPGASARLAIDGAAAGEARVNEHGRFSISLPSGLAPGDHEAAVQCGDQSVSVKFTVAHPGPITGLPYHGERTPAGWRIDWLTPGGGEQTTQIFDAAES
ncbi:MAG TPA: hypothetical protein VHY32_01980 [Caulobacteraceae bacterium]|jgi:hypothetical protein|nr:hypothetical protein [Caulobacteraceae bacterium]